MRHIRQIKRFVALAVLGMILTGCGENHYKKGIEELEAGQYQEAASQFKGAIKDENNLADSYRGLGMALWETEDYEGARDAFVKALDKESEKTGTIYNLLGNCELQLENPEAALSWYEKGLAQKDNSGELTQEMEFNTIVAYEKLEQWDQAKEKLALYVEKYPEDEAAAKEAEFLKTR